MKQEIAKILLEKKAVTLNPKFCKTIKTATDHKASFKILFKRLTAEISIFFP